MRVLNTILLIALSVAAHSQAIQIRSATEVSGSYWVTPPPPPWGGSPNPYINTEHLNGTQSNPSFAFGSWDTTWYAGTGSVIAAAESFGEFGELHAYAQSKLTGNSAFSLTRAWAHSNTTTDDIVRFTSGWSVDIPASNISVTYAIHSMLRTSTYGSSVSSRLSVSDFVSGDLFGSYDLTAGGLLPQGDSWQLCTFNIPLAGHIYPPVIDVFLRSDLDVSAEQRDNSGEATLDLSRTALLTHIGVFGSDGREISSKSIIGASGKNYGAVPEPKFFLPLSILFIAYLLASRK